MADDFGEAAEKIMSIMTNKPNKELHESIKRRLAFIGDHPPKDDPQKYSIEVVDGKKTRLKRMKD